jgi:hypothetical protein
MFRVNKRHRQKPLFSDFGELPEKLREKLEVSWAETFYSAVFSRLDESIFEVLYSDEPSRPNIPVNVLVGLEIMKAGFGWSDEEMYDAFCYNVQVRYALGYQNLGEGHFELRTMYNFRARLVKWMHETGDNLIEKAFAQITDEQIATLELKTGKMRMDSTQVASNIRQMSRLQLLVEVLQRVERSLSEVDRARYAELFAPYMKGTSGQYVYHIKPGEGEERLQSIGQAMRRLAAELAEGYRDNTAYQLLARVFGEHFIETEGKLRARVGDELSAESVQSPYDLDATYREKRGKGYKGYVANVTESCDPENDVQLIVKMQVEPNTTDDADLMAQALPEIKVRTDVEEMHTDGGYNGEATDAALETDPLEHIQTAIRGGQPDPDRLHLSDFTWEADADGEPQQITCPAGEQAEVNPGRRANRYIARFPHDACAQCPLAGKCPSKPRKRKRGRVLRFSKRDLNIARRRQNHARQRASGKNLRSAVEATVRSVKHPFRNGKLPVRGRPRVSMMMIASAAMCNVRRIWRYETAKNEAEAAQAEGQGVQQLTSLLFFVRRLRDSIRRCTLQPLLRPVWL